MALVVASFSGGVGLGWKLHGWVDGVLERGGTTENVSFKESQEAKRSWALFDHVFTITSCKKEGLTFICEFEVKNVSEESISEVGSVYILKSSVLFSSGGADWSMVSMFRSETSTAVPDRDGKFLLNIARGVRSRLQIKFRLSSDRYTQTEVPRSAQSIKLFLEESQPGNDPIESQLHIPLDSDSN